MNIQISDRIRNKKYKSSYIFKAHVVFEDPDGDPVRANVLYELVPPAGFLLQYAPPAGSRAIVLAIDIPEQITIGGHQIDAETIFNNTANEKYIELIKAIEEVL